MIDLEYPRERIEAVKIKEIVTELQTTLDTVSEAIQIADRNGEVKYVNSAFLSITSLSAEERVGKNIFIVAPDSPLATTLRKGQKIANYKTRLAGTRVEVISRVSPIIVDGLLIGAVEILQPLIEVTKLEHELQLLSNTVNQLTKRLGQITRNKYTFDNLIGNNEQFRQLILSAKKTSVTNNNVLILGETGSGKEVLAHAIHSGSLRWEKPFIKVNCVETPESLLERELFGHEMGAVGKFELANEGTIFLDEIGEMNLYLQEKVLKVLETMEYNNVQNGHTIRTDVRVIASTNRNILEMIRKGAFREDLYYRLNPSKIEVPPLRERKDDIPLLVNGFIVKLNRQLGKKVRGITKSAERVLAAYDWPGNIKELENVIERAMVVVEDDVITHKHLDQYINGLDIGINSEPMAEILPFHEMEQILLKMALNRFGDSVDGKKKAAKALNISLATLYNKLKKYQLV